MTFKELSIYIQKIEETASRNDMTTLLSDLFKKLSPDEIDKVIYILQGRLTPQYVKLDFNLGEKLVEKALYTALNLDRSVFNKRYKEIGDLGETAQEFKNEIQSILEDNLSIVEVYKKLYILAEKEGSGSQESKISLLGELVQTLDPLSVRYLIRIPTNTLRLGFSAMTILDAYSWMLAGDKSLRKDIERAYHVLPDLGHIGILLKSKGLKGIENIEPRIFTPILMMRAQRLPVLEEIIKKIGKGIVEPKYDGFRLQIHYDGKEVRLYSRGLDDVTFMYPDIVEGIKKEVVCDSIILEGEAIGFDPYSTSFLPFQQTVQRKRKYNIEEKVDEIPLKMFAFEMLYADGKSYLREPLEHRIETMKKCIKLTGDIHEDTLLISPESIQDSAKGLEKEFEEAISKGLEGIMIKKIDGEYQPGARGWNWIKYKRSESSKIDDTIDCVVMGYDTGKGKRVSFGIGAFLVGIYDEKEDMYKTVAKIGTGLTDDEFREMKRKCDTVESSHKPALYDTADDLKVDVWVKPQIVVEIKADEITRSSMHTAGRTMKKTQSGRGMEVDMQGYALRFPRLTRFRDDKKPEDATTLQELEDMFKEQL